MKYIESAFSGIARLMLALATFFLLLMTALVILASFMRYIAGRPFGFTEEMVALLYMSMVFLAVPIATLRRGHISISVLPNRIATLLKYPLYLAACVAMIAFCAWFSLASYGFVEQSYRFASRSEQAEFLLWPWMALIPITMSFVGIITLLHLLQGLKDRALADTENLPPAGDAL